jgi:hypothetical protein
MPVNFLDLVPEPPRETLILATASGSAQVELTGLRLSTLADLAKRYPAFARIIEGGAGSIIQASDALPAVVAAGLGHAGDAQYEAKVATFPTAHIMQMAMTVVRLTFPQSEAATLDPLPEALAASNGAAGEPVPAVTSLRPSSN